MLGDLRRRPLAEGYVEKVMLAHNWYELGQVSSADVVCVSVITIFETL